MRNYAGSAMMLVTTMVAAVGCYTINLKVSSERAGVESLRTQLVADARETRNLQPELRTRARFPELQRWNDNVLQMSAPSAGQFLRSPLELASYAAAPAAKPGIVYAVTTPEAAAPMTAPLVTVAYEPAPAAADTAPRLIRAGYAVPQRAVAPAVELAAPAPRRTAEAAPADRPERAQLARAETRPADVRRAEIKKAEPKKAAAVKADAPHSDAPALGAPIDLLPQGGQ